MTEPGGWNEPVPVDGPDPAAARLIADLVARGQTLAVAESLTGGLVGTVLTSVPGASRVVRGGVIAYATDLKSRLLGVSEDLLAEVGAIHPEVARQMAAGVRDRLGATYGLATTGVAGPDAQDGQAPGTVLVAVAGPDGEVTRALQLSGDRSRIRAASVRAVLALLAEVAGVAGAGVA